ncbi:hypothetical protein BAE29_15890 [Acidithiobacillus caldus]|uniref:Uncharacterized protein n=1 Tax=Acidithiobacillus caldus TaxID=33059 RepID=A0A1E7YR19_9PROT|nr:hypothetical protein BAE29_15890 [Acidithiobacillus caldus]OFC38601.1 hypothetical protein BAE27_01855 [Acidithiobacillus caldus]OFC40169.1 hypothetical protein BAE28_01120 [Acidithiobacillus caldus]
MITSHLFVGYPVGAKQAWEAIQVNGLTRCTSQEQRGFSFSRNQWVATFQIASMKKPFQTRNLPKMLQTLPTRNQKRTQVLPVEHQVRITG